ncbi:30S ribosomal protein S6 [Ichthyobacterium seriolicida]|uniref:Small ribosomal subunit protein bS6 n=1 Tax=Ichthyobacterium seriolicida TaxID=242600 RepID=A0A1J1DWD9_9FLAO|nr:30S ribosomal protein S6 [Ichthyobacterium seriolicida]BAV94183.1 30S ribosomal protein S6 [Ichthyobacterium seriolicida]
MKCYETVFIYNPVLSDVQVDESVRQYKSYLESRGAEIISIEKWGLKKLAYQIQNKKTGFYNLIQFQGEGDLVSDLELEFRRNEHIMRFLTVSLDKHALDYAEQRRNKLKSVTENKQ